MGEGGGEGGGSAEEALIKKFYNDNYHPRLRARLDITVMVEWA